MWKRPDTSERNRLRATHGASCTSTYRIWASMLARCGNPKNRAYANYGGRGIRVSERWLKFENFLADMGERPAGKALDRINNDGHYEPGNCRWATRIEQNNNKRTNTLITAFGRTQTLAQWAREFRGVISRAALESRLRRGWPPERALSEPTIKRG